MDNDSPAAVPSYGRSLCRALLIGFAILVVGVLPSRAERFEQVLGPKPLEFPKDHGAHPEYETEWWYFTGHLYTEENRPFGFELTFFRVGVDPQTTSPSIWAARSLYLAHFTITDDREGKFYQAERLSRGAFEEAGAAEGNLQVWAGDWSAVATGEEIELKAASQEASLQLRVVSRKAPVLHGEKGFSRKAAGAGDASLYYSLSRLVGAGELQIGSARHRITRASVWMDREVTSSKLAHGMKGWDWFALQLENGEEVMVYQLRAENGSPSSFSSGTVVRKDGATERLNAGDFRITSHRSWRSPDTGIEYPAGWTIDIPRLSYRFQVEPTVAGQEVQSPMTTGITYWEGRALVRGTPADGDAYVELVGYEKRGASVGAAAD